MVNFLENLDFFKQLGFDVSNQWILYDESTQKFFNWLSENCSEMNLLSDTDLLQENALKNRGQLYDEYLLSDKLNELNEKYPIFDYTDDEVSQLEDDLDITKDTIDMFDNLAVITNLQEAHFDLNAQLRELEDDILKFEHKCKIVYNSCCENAKDLLELQRENNKLCAEINDTFTIKQYPPIFAHQLPIDQYLLKCDLFHRYFTLYLQANFKFQDSLDNDDSFLNDTEDAYKLENLKNQICYYQEKFIVSKSKAVALKEVIDSFDISYIHTIDEDEIKMEADELEMTHETLINELKMHLDQYVQQQIELALYENTKEKIERANQRIDNINVLSKIVSDALSNSDLVWILMQLDSEKIKNRTDYSERLNIQNKNCLERIKVLRQLQLEAAEQISRCDLFMAEASEIMTIGKSNKVTISDFLYDCEKFNQITDLAFQNIPTNRSYGNAIEFFNKSNSIEGIFHEYLYNGPGKLPIIGHMQFLNKIYKSKKNEETIVETLRQLRSEFCVNISERMNSDPLWNNSQLLWIWFLTDPIKISNALEEVKKAAAKKPSKTLSGIMRK